MKTIFAVALLAVSVPAFAEGATTSSDAWQGARPDIAVSVSQGDTPDTYKVNAVVTDLRSGDVLSEPVMVAYAGKAARAEIGGIGTDGLMSIAFSVTVDHAGDTAAYSSEVRNNAEVVSSQSATLAVTE